MKVGDRVVFNPLIDKDRVDISHDSWEWDMIAQNKGSCIFTVTAVHFDDTLSLANNRVGYILHKDWFEVIETHTPLTKEDVKEMIEKCEGFESVKFKDDCIEYRYSDNSKNLLTNDYQLRFKDYAYRPEEWYRDESDHGHCPTKFVKEFSLLLWYLKLLREEEVSNND